MVLLLFAVGDDLSVVRCRILTFLLHSFQHVQVSKPELHTFAELTAFEIVSIALCSGVPATKDVHIFGPALCRYSCLLRYHTSNISLDRRRVSCCYNTSD
jgi:hypothetical protein